MAKKRKTKKQPAKKTSKKQPPKQKGGVKAKRKTDTRKKKAARKTVKQPASRSRKAASRKAQREPKILISPGYQGRPTKIARDTYPENAKASDFCCFGPAAIEDGCFECFRICDMGCFDQDGKDSNKYYHGAVVQNRKSKNWYAYFEWGRTGGTSRSFQFVACQSEQDARAAFAKQLHAKNDKRGEWVTVAKKIRTLRAKKGKDCYLVRPMATRTTGLPHARNIKTNQGSKAVRQACDSLGDPKTMKLLRELRVATIAYTRKSMADSSIPTQAAVDEARAILGEAHERVGAIEDSVEAQIQDKKLMQLTRLMFSRIPRKKKVGAPASTWVLSQANIRDWHEDLDAFESALHAVDIELNPDIDILGEMNLSMEWIKPQSKLGEFLYAWVPRATADRHRRIKSMAIKNIWQVNRNAAEGLIPTTQSRILRGKIDLKEKAANQPRTRIDVPAKQRAAFRESNTALLLHGTRSVNVTGILRESLRLPETLVAVTLTGAKFGPGIYFSDDWKKAADYTNAKGSAEAGRKGIVKGREAFLFAADVVLGTPYVAPGVQGFAKPPRGHHSVFGKADHSGVDHNEFIVYKSDQCKLRYLIEFKAA